MKLNAVNRVRNLSIAGVASLTLTAGISGAVDVGVIRNDTNAGIANGAFVQAARGVDVNALQGRWIQSYVMSLATGLLGVAGSVSVWSLGGNLSADAIDSLNTKDEDQLAMHGLAYPLAVELRQIPLLML